MLLFKKWKYIITSACIILFLLILCIIFKTYDDISENIVIPYLTISENNNLRQVDNIEV